MKKPFSVRSITQSAVVAALYAALSLLCSWLNLAYGPIQFRFSEALCLLPLVMPETAWGLWVGCLLANLLSPFGPLDIIVGSCSTLLAALLTARCHRKWTACLPPVLCNAVLVGAILAWQEVGSSAAFLLTFLYHALTIAASEAVICFALGIPLITAWEKHSQKSKKIS